MASSDELIVSRPTLTKLKTALLTLRTGCSKSGIGMPSSASSCRITNLDTCCATGSSMDSMVFVWKTGIFHVFNTKPHRFDRFRTLSQSDYYQTQNRIFRTAHLSQRYLPANAQPTCCWPPCWRQNSNSNHRDTTICVHPAYTLIRVKFVLLFQLLPDKMKVLTFFCTFYIIFDLNRAVWSQQGRGRIGDCPAVSLKNGRVRYRQRGRIAKFVCNGGFTLAGQRFGMCNQGKWEESPPKCVKATCPPVKPSQNLLIFPSYLGAVLNFYCKSNYAMKGAAATYCDGTKWDNQLPTCLASNTHPAMKCDFESEDLCGWMHDLNHDFDWIRYNYATPTHLIGTGPSHDHTKGEESDGYYMYIESSSKNPNDTARLLSPIYERKANTPICFQFWYHMYGKTTGELRVYLKYTNDTWTLDPNRALFRKQGNQGNAWYKSYLYIGEVARDYQIIIEGVCGSSFVSDIAIDDVAIIENCTLPMESTTITISSSTEQPFSVESCENRCGSNETDKDLNMWTCDCDDTCWDRNKCCPDYLELCTGTSVSEVADSTSEKASTEQKNSERTETTLKVVSTTLDKVTVPQTTLRMTTAIVTATQPSMTLRMTGQSSTTLKMTTQPSTTLRMTEATIEVKKPQKTTHSIDLSNDIDSEWDDSASPEVVLKEQESNKILTDKITVENHDKIDNTHRIVFALGVCFGILFMVSILAVLAKKYHIFRRRRSGNYSSSASDVRFLTGDEVLDLSVRDYDE